MHAEISTQMFYMHAKMLRTAGAKEPFYQFYLMSDILEKPEEFEKTARRLVLSEWRQAWCLCSSRLMCTVLIAC